MRSVASGSDRPVDQLIERKRVTRVCAVPNEALTYSTFAMHPILRYRAYRLRRGANQTTRAGPSPLSGHGHLWCTSGSAPCSLRLRSGLGEAQVKRLVGDEAAEELVRVRGKGRVGVGVGVGL